MTIVLDAVEKLAIWGVNAESCGKWFVKNAVRLSGIESSARRFIGEGRGLSYLSR